MNIRGQKISLLGDDNFIYVMMLPKICLKKKKTLRKRDRVHFRLSAYQKKHCKYIEIQCVRMRKSCNKRS